MRIIGNAEKAREVQAVASGVLPSGQPVVVNAGGTVSVAGETTISQGAGSNTIFEAAESSWGVSVYDSNAKRVVIAYQDGGNQPGVGTAVVCAVNGTSLTFGTPVVFETDEVNHISVAFDSSNNKIVIAWHNYNSGTDTDTGKAIVGTVNSSNNSISFGSATTFESGNCDSTGCGFDSTNNKIVIAYKDHNNFNRGTAIVGTVSDTSISFGSAVVFDATTTTRNTVMFDSSNDKIVIAYSDQADGDDGKAIVGTVSGTSISFGSPTKFETGGVFGNWMGGAFDSTNNKIAIAYAANNNSAYGTGIVGTVSGTSISFGTPTVFQSGQINDVSAAFNTAAGKVIFAYKNASNSSTGTYIEGTVSGTSISFNTSATFPSTADAIYTSVSYDSDQYASVISFRNTDNSQYGTAFSYQSAASPTNLTSENYIGMSGGVVDFVNQAVGSPQVFESANSRYISSTFDSTNNKVVIAYRDEANSGYGTAVVGTVSGNSISFGTPVVFYNTYEVSHITVNFDSSNNKVVIVFYQTNNDYGLAVVGTVSGTSISFGSAVGFSGSNQVVYPSSTFDSSNNKIVIAYGDGSGNGGYALVGAVSGTSISFGSATAFNSGSTTFSSTSFDSSNNKVVIAYDDGGNSHYGTAVVGTVSGTSISFGAETVFESAEAQQIGSTFDSSNNKVVIAYQDNGNSGYGTAVVGTVSGTGISFGAPVIFESARSNNSSVTFDTSSNKVVIAYQDVGNSNYGTFISGTVSGDSISFGDATVFESANSDSFGTTFDNDSNKVVLAYRDRGNSDYGTGIVVQTASSTRGQVADGGNAEINIKGAVDENQSGLTAGQSYYVQTDGTLSTTAGDPSVFAGTAVAATKLIVKG